MASSNRDYTGITKTIELAFDESEVSLAFSASAAVKPYIYSIDLNESISNSFDAKLVVFLEKKLKAQELREHLQKRVYITLKQLDAGVEVRKQVLYGMVTGYRSIGLVATSTESSRKCYQYELSVQSMLAKLSINRKNCTYQGTVNDVLTSIFSNYQDVLQIDFTNPDNSEKVLFSDDNLVFSQNSESDLSFINRLCSLFGINYTLVYPSDSEYTKVCFSQNWACYVNDSSDASSFKKSTQFSKNVKDKFDEYLIDSAEYQEVFDECSIFDENADSSKREYQFELTKLSCLGKRGLNKDFEKLCAIDLKSHFKNSVKNTESKLVAVSYDLGYTPGLLLKIDSIDDCGAPADTEYFVVRRSVKFKQKFSEDFMQPDSDTDDDYMLKQVILAVPVDSDRMPGSFSMVDCLSLGEEGTSICSIDGITPVLKSVKKNGTANDKSVPAIMEATVCDRPDGVNEISDTELQSIFYAKIDSQVWGSGADAVEEQYIAVQLFKNDSELACKLPRKGQKVLVIYSEGRFYSLGVMASSDGRKLYSSNLKNMLQNSSIHTIDGRDLFFDDDLSSFDIDNNSSGFFKFSDPQAYVEHLLMQGTFGRLAENLDSVHNTLSFSKIWNDSFKLRSAECRSQLIQARSSYSEKLKNYRDLTEKDREDNSQSQNVSQALQEVNAAEQILNSNIQSLSDITSQIVEACDAVKIGSRQNLLSALFENEVVNYEVNSNNNLSLNSNSGVMTLSGSKLNLSADDNQTFEATDSICFKAGQKISLQVGQSTIEITDMGIKLVSSQYGNSSGLVSSSLSLDGIMGTTLTGDTVFIKGIERVSLSDYFGGSAGVYAGNASLSGMNVNITSGAETLSRINTIIGLGNSILSAFDNDDEEMASVSCKFAGAVFGANLTTAMSDIKDFVSGSHKEIFSELQKDWKAKKKIDAIQLALEGLVVAEEIVMCIQNIIFECTIAGMQIHKLRVYEDDLDSNDAKSLQKSIDKTIEWMRKLNYVEWYVKFSTIALETIASYAVHSAVASSAINLAPEDITFDSTELKEATKSNTTLKSIGAGLSMSTGSEQSSVDKTTESQKDNSSIL